MEFDFKLSATSRVLPPPRPGAWLLRTSLESHIYTFFKKDFFLENIYLFVILCIIMLELKFLGVLGFKRSL